MSLGSFSDGKLDPDVASAYNVEVVKSKLKAIEALGLKDSIDDILITLDTQYHLINCTEKGTHMIYLAADKKKANLALLRAVVAKGKKEIQSKL
ncbi:roadblock/LC7 domain-containing protein [Marinoscillum sp.]|uniref:roadblock/LC7 domain-containing protein n=1 Tax=Marinoscillum sp. TaxID=2024838 RepID=UPI003BAA38A0